MNFAIFIISHHKTPPARFTMSATSTPTSSPPSTPVQGRRVQVCPNAPDHPSTPNRPTQPTNTVPVRPSHGTPVGNAKPPKCPDAPSRNARLGKGEESDEGFSTPERRPFPGNPSAPKRVCHCTPVISGNSAKCPGAPQKPKERPVLTRQDGCIDGGDVLKVGRDVSGDADPADIWSNNPY